MIANKRTSQFLFIFKTLVILTNFPNFLENFESQNWTEKDSWEPYSAVARKTTYTVNSSVILKQNFAFLTKKKVGNFVLFQKQIWLILSPHFPV